MAELKEDQVGEGIDPEKDEKYYNAGDIAANMHEAKALVYNGNNLVTLGLAEDDLGKIIEGLEQVGKGSAEIADKAKFFQRVMDPDNHYKVIIAIREMVVTRDE